MNKKLAQEIYRACPIIFRNRGDGPHHTLMCFGFECGPGWFDLIFELSKRIEAIANDMKASGTNDALPLIVQVKEKFGSLRFYLHNSTPEIAELIREAEQSSSRLCEVCGQSGTLKQNNGWFTTLCDTCSEAENGN